MQEPLKKMKAGQRGCIYAVAGELGLIERGNPDDDLHVLVYRVTGKHSLSLLSNDEADKVIDALSELIQQAAAAKKPSPAVSPSKHEQRPGGITADQQRKVWRLMYLLRDKDAVPSTATLGERLCGIIRKTLKVDCTPEQPFRFVTLEGGWKLIEAIKHLLSSVEKKKAGI